MKKLQKVLVAMILILLMIVLPMTIHNVTAEGPSGESYSLQSYEQNPTHNYPQYGECEHTDINGPNDMMVGLGVFAHYDINDQTPAYSYGNWWFSAQAGWSTSTTNNSPVQIMPPMEETVCIDYGLSTQSYTNYYDYSSGTWTNGYYYNSVWSPIGHYCSVDSDQTSQALNDRTSVEGVTSANFYNMSSPNTLYFYQCYTQLPPGHGMPGNIPSFAYLTAHPYSDGGDW